MEEIHMKIGFVGLGKMGGGMVGRLLSGGHEVVAFDPIKEAMKQAENKGAVPTSLFEELVDQLDAPRAIWIMVPSGKPTGETITSLSYLLGERDILIDGGNSFYKDSMKRAQGLKEKGISFLDVGTSGGIWGPKIGYCYSKPWPQKKVTPMLEQLALVIL